MTREGLERYDITPEGFAYATNMAIIQEGLDQGVEPRLLHRAARFFQARSR